MDLRKQLFSEWQIVECIGVGAAGTVYKIKKNDISGTYFSALKVINIPRHSEIIALKREGRTNKEIDELFESKIAKLSKELFLLEKFKGITNIVSYEDHKIIKKNIGWDLLIRMELLSPLKQYEKKMGEKDVVQLGIDICSALEVCEKENIIHCDIKPANVFVSKIGDYKLGDFGMAAYVTEKCTIRGTYTYMAPEVYYGLNYDHRIDIYSLGLLLYRLCNACVAPFLPYGTGTYTASQIKESNMLRLKGNALPKPANASFYLSRIILKACQYDREKRYQSAGNFKTDLERCKSFETAMDNIGFLPQNVCNAEKNTSLVSAVHNGFYKAADVYFYEGKDLT